ncbi:hypothetical protein CL628_02550 [bacterium]|nr:hypothetical protein [bacterium]
MRITSVILLITLLALIVRGVALTSPREVVFDEVHFGKFVNAYCCTGERFFDIHPPHAKLLIAAIVGVTGYQGDFEFKNIGDEYPSRFPITLFRLLPMLVGALVPLIVLLLIRQLGGSWPIAAFGGLALALDNALIVQSRLISLDMVLLSSTFGAVSLFLAGERRFGSSQSWWLFVAAGGAAGLAIGTKFTGLVALGLLGIMVLVHLWQTRAMPKDLSRWIVAGAVVLVSAAAVYFLGWAMHWSLLPLPGPGDAFHNPDLSGGVVSFFSETIAHHRVMLTANFNLTAAHPYASIWWQWPLLVRPVFYWQSGTAFIYLLGNPIVWWGSTVLFIIALIARIVSFGRRRLVGTAARMWIPLVGLLLALFPFARIPRALFLYHYFTPLILTLVIGLLWLDSASNERRKRGVVIAGSIAVAVAFVWFLPLTYGLPVPTSLHSFLFWFSSWR